MLPWKPETKSVSDHKYCNCVLQRESQQLNCCKVLRPPDRISQANTATPQCLSGLISGDVTYVVWWNSRNPCCNCRPLHVWIWNYKQLPANHVFASHCTPAFASQTATHSYTPFKRHANPDTASPVWHKRTSTILELEYFLETAGMIAEILCMTKGRYTGVLSSTGLHVAKCDPKSFWVRPVHGS